MSGGWAVFDTPIGPCGIAWGPLGVRGAQLPQADAEATRVRMARRFPALAEREPPAQITRLIAALQALLGGEARDLADTRLDFTGVPDFHRRVYAAALAVPPGRTVTYGEIALRLGEPGAARAVGQALGANPFAPIVPCHRVLAAGGRTGGFSAHGGTDTKRRLLAIEGARPDDQPSLF
ncbi:MAG: methylated-DNA--[protein]-cysteine S-methyltransferase [Burkholderiales bacterium]|nr:methylated-DNA--[protein]-cysteine S-methyltransferase [Burkholderiales bacterium]